jgi:hypothetical protein
MDAVELDGELSTIGRRYFDLRGPRLHLYTADARPWLAASSAKYDSIFVDTYRQPYIPFYMATREFFGSVSSHLNPGGTVIVNVGHIPGSDALEQVVSATMHAVFPVVIRDRVSATNSLVEGSLRPLSGAQLIGTHADLPDDLQGLDASVAGRLGPAPRGGPVYTDDRAPVEWLTDLSILRYATGTR